MAESVVNNSHISIAKPELPCIINTLPPELLIIIFVLCLPSNSKCNSEAIIRQAPPLLGQVCSRWSYIVATVPELWTSLEMDIESVNPGTVGIWLQRAKSFPINLRLAMGIGRYARNCLETTVPWAQITSLELCNDAELALYTIRSILQQCPNLVTCEFTGVSGLFYMELEMPPVPIITLHSLKAFSITYHSHTYKAAYEDRDLTYVSPLFEWLTLPALQELHVHSTLTGPKPRWDPNLIGTLFDLQARSGFHLRRLHLNSIMDWGTPNRDIRGARTLRSLLAQMPTLQHLYFESDFRLLSMQYYLSYESALSSRRYPNILPNLEELVIVDCDDSPYGIGELAKHLMCMSMMYMLHSRWWTDAEGPKHEGLARLRSVYINHGGLVIRHPLVRWEGEFRVEGILLLQPWA